MHCCLKYFNMTKAKKENIWIQYFVDSENYGLCDILIMHPSSVDFSE